MKAIILGLVATTLAFTGCNKCHDHEDGVTGDWKRTDYYGNDSWGGPFAWHNGADGTQVRFTADGHYYRANAKTTLALVGTYRLSGNKIIITGLDGTGPSETFTYDVQRDRLNLKYSRTESVLEENFERQ